MDNKVFLFLYPIEPYIDQEINERYSDPIKTKLYRIRFTQIMNQCIQTRYREKGFKIYFAIFDDCEMCKSIKFLSCDQIIKVGLNIKEHEKKRADGTYPYPNPDYIFDQIKITKQDVLRIGGFHATDCVDRVAKAAYEKGYNIMVDEDLTDLLHSRLDDPDFKINEYPSFNYKRGYKDNDPLILHYIKKRESMPWLCQY